MLRNSSLVIHHRSNEPMYVCMYVCMFTIYVCMYVCMYVHNVCMYVCMYVCVYVHVHCIQVTQLKAFIQSSNPSTPSHSLQRASHHQRSDVSDLALALAGANVWERGSIHLQLRAPPKKKRRKRRVSQLAQTLSKTPSPPFPQ